MLGTVVSAKHCIDASYDVFAQNHCLVTWLVLLLVVHAGVALAAEGAWALPPIISVKNLRARAGPAYKWKVANRVISPLSGPIYPGQTGTARVSVDVERTSITKNYVVSGKLIITNPMQNQQLLEVTGLKASFSPLIPLLSPLPQLLDCPAEQLQPGQSLSCNFRIDLPSGVVNTLTPQVLVKGMPQLEGEPLTLSWPSDEDRQLPSGKVVDAESSCALIQTQVLGGDLQQLVQVSAAGEYQDMFSTGLEVCEDKASLEYTVTVVSLNCAGWLRSAAGCDCAGFTVQELSCRVAAAYCACCIAWQNNSSGSRQGSRRTTTEVAVQDLQLPRPQQQQQ